MALIGVFEDLVTPADKEKYGHFRDLDRRWVRLTVTMQQYVLDEMKKENAIAEWVRNEEEKKKKRDFTLHRNCDVKLLKEIEPLESDGNRGLSSIYGSKAAQYFLIDWKKISPDPIWVKSLAVPFYFYNTFMNEIGGTLLIDELIQLSSQAESNVDLFASGYLDVGMERDTDELAIAGSEGLHNSFLMSFSSEETSISTPLFQTVESHCHKIIQRIMEGESQILSDLCTQILETLKRWREENEVSHSILQAQSSHSPPSPSPSPSPSLTLLLLLSLSFLSRILFSLV
jgi:hypothetical protein